MSKTDNVVSLPDRAAAQSTVNRLMARAKAIDDEITAIVQAEYLAAAESEDSRIDNLARKLVSGEPFEAEMRGTAHRLTDLRNEAQIIGRALTIGIEQRDQAARREANKVVAGLRPQHRLAVARVAQCLVALSEAIDAERSIRAKAPGIGTQLPIGGFPGVGSMRDPSSPVRLWLKHVKHTGALIELPSAAE